MTYFDNKSDRTDNLTGTASDAPESAARDSTRREFFGRVAAIAPAAGAAVALAKAARGQGAASGAPAAQPAKADSTGPAKTFVGIQMGPHTILDEGIEHTLDLIAETAAVNCVIPYSHGYNNAFIKSLRDRADHGVPITDNRGRNFPMIWVHPHEQYYKNTTLRHQKVTDQHEHSKRDLFAEMLEPCRKRGIKLYPRVLEAGQRQIANFEKVVTRTMDDQPTNTACWRHPEYIGFWADTMEDLFKSYDLDGIQWGAERHGPLMDVISPWNNAPPTCFCEHCVKAGKAAGIDPERARTGYRELYNYVQARKTNQPRPADGVFVGFLRVLMHYPEILSWEYQYRLGREAIYDAMYKRVKSVKPTAEVGWHVDHQPTSWDLVYRAEMSYADMAPHSDFLKIIVYHKVLGPRIRDWYIARIQSTIFGEVPPEDSLNLYYDLFGYDKNVEPKLNELRNKGFSPDYVYRETKRSLASAEGKLKIYSGVGFGVPGSPPDNPEDVYQATVKAMEAGANGIVISREYEEMKVDILKAVGRAVRGA